MTPRDTVLDLFFSLVPVCNSLSDRTAKFSPAGSHSWSRKFKNMWGHSTFCYYLYCGCVLRNRREVKDNSCPVRVMVVGRCQWSAWENTSSRLYCSAWQAQYFADQLHNHCQDFWSSCVVVRTAGRHECHSSLGWAIFHIRQAACKKWTHFGHTRLYMWERRYKHHSAPFICIAARPNSWWEGSSSFANSCCK